MSNQQLLEAKEISLTQEQIASAAEQFEHASPQELLRYGLETFGNTIALACSFGAEDVVLVDMLMKINPSAKIFYLDTDVLFPETYAVRDAIIERYQPQQLIQYSPLLSLQEQKAQYGAELWGFDPNSCCNIRKVEPLERALLPLKAWITGIRRDQAPTRANAKVVESDQRFRLVKLNPLASWTNEQVWDYIKENNVPYNVLHDQGYPSIGCIHCTRQVKPGEDPRAGRWAGFQKTECGLHMKN
ncbi:phosphoadenylyl-sulfate reductase [Fodinisporobacter ferrooxydans]|uniref:Adenosine 5'-phosphosulfate reductase n=1 Tax=Fodinisporobacter ferrooxydans TaxID=2901836 RepID=A0ABY4CVM9_9BACL|nr:phosphoadenylyl-sulfate reductase [Alicyclobacillaceae bacterium MYW30-H2]